MSDTQLPSETLSPCKRHKWSLSLGERMVEKRSNMTTKYFRLQRLHQCLKCGYKKWSDV
jgi:hypothetical protein